MSHSSSSANSKAKIEAAVEDAAVSSASSAASSGTIDLSGLTRNTYIIMGMLGGALVLLIGVVAKLFAGSRNNTGCTSKSPTSQIARRSKRDMMVVESGHCVWAM